MHFGFPGSSGRSWRPRSLAGAPRSRERKLRLDTLESRCLFSVTPIGESIFVGDPAPYLFGNDTARVAVAADGGFVVAWQQRETDSSNQDIRARRFDASGNPLAEFFVVNTYVAGNQTNPTLAMNDDGKFVIAWQSSGQDGSGEGIFSQLYDENGVAVGGEIAVNTTTAGNQEFPAAAMDSAGNVLIAWSGNQFRRFDTGGVALGGESYAGSSFGDKPAVAFDGAGNFIVASASYGSFAYRQYHTDGAPFKSTTSSYTYNYPGFGGFAEQTRIATNASGEFAIGASDSGILVQRFDRNGEPQGEVKRIPASDSQGTFVDFGLVLDTAGNYTVSAITLEGGDFMDGSLALYPFDSDGTAQPVLAIAAGKSPYDSAALAMNPSGQMVLVWVGIPSNVELYAQRLQVDSLRATGIHTSQYEDVHVGEPIPLPVTQLSVSFSLPVSTDGGTSGLHSVTNPANWQLWRGSTNVSDLIVGVTYQDGRATIEFSVPLQTGDYRLIASDAIQDLQGILLDGNNDGSPGGSAELPFTIGVIHPTTDRIDPHNGANRIAVAANGGGSFVAVWVRGGRLYGQTYTAAGLTVGPRKTLANVSGTGTDVLLQVGVDGAGNYHVLWRGTGNAYTSLFSFDASGSLLRPVMQLGAYAQQLAVAADGRIAILDSGTAQVYDAGGAVVGPPLTLGIDLVGIFGITFLPNGDLAAAGARSFIQNSVASYRIYVRRFDSASIPLGDAQVVSELTSFDPSAAMIAANPAGGFVIGWHQLTLIPSSNPARYRRDVNIRVYDPVGLPLTSTIQVNSEGNSSTTAANPKLPPLVAFDSAGHFVVSWQNVGVDDDDLGIAARGYFADGTPLGAQFRINSPQYSDQYAPSLAADAGGNLLFSWTTSQDNAHLQYYRVFELPKLDLNGAAPGVDFDSEVTTNGPAVSIAVPTLTIEDAGFPAAGARVQIKAPLAGDVLLVDTTGTAIVAQYADGVLVLSGSDSRTHYEQVLRTARFQTSATRPAIAAIDIEFVVDFGTVLSTTATTRLLNYVPGAASIVDRFLFYNASAFDDSNPAINTADGYARATDKAAYLPGSGLATFASVSSYSQGINGIMLYISTGHGQISLDDFMFRVGTNNSPDTWVNAPAASAIGTAHILVGVDRVTVTWPDGAIKNTWLEVTVAANARTGLAAPDVFYFGNKVGDSGTSPGAGTFNTTSTDAAQVFATIGSNKPITNPRDYNRDGQVTSTDADIVFASIGSLVRIDLPGPLQLLAAMPQGDAARIDSDRLVATPLVTSAEASTKPSVAEGIASALAIRAATAITPSLLGTAVVTLPRTEGSMARLDERAVGLALADEILIDDDHDELQQDTDDWLGARYLSRSARHLVPWRR